MGDTTMTDTVVVITGAAPLTTPLPGGLDELLGDARGDVAVIAADGALDHALAAGLRPEFVVGDLDSISDDALAWAEANAKVERYEPDKDATDTELALALAADLNPARLVVIGGGARLDHTFAAIGALGNPTLTSVPTIDGWWDDHHVLVVHGPGRRTHPIAPGTTLSLLALHGEAHGVSLTGVEWPLAAVTIDPLSGLGISNVATDPEITITVHHGVVTIFIPPTSLIHPASEEPPRPS